MTIFTSVSSQGKAVLDLCITMCNNLEHAAEFDV